MCAVAVSRGWAPGTVNLTQTDPAVAAQLPCVVPDPVEGRLRGILSTSFGFGGLNAALTFSEIRSA
jgi:3-oxoacyl-(acyl-carrier-protein) synthase